MLVATGTLPPRDEQIAMKRRIATGSSPSAPALASAGYCTSTPPGTSSAGFAAAWPGRTPLTASSSPLSERQAAIALLDWLPTAG